MKTFRFFKSTGILFQRTDAVKANVCFPELVHLVHLVYWQWGKLALEVEEHQQVEKLKFITQKNHWTRIKGTLGLGEPKLRSNYQQAPSSIF